MSVAPIFGVVSDSVTFEPSVDGFHGRISGDLTLEKVTELQTRSREHFGDTPAVWAVVDLSEAIPLDASDHAGQDRQIDSVNQLARRVMLVRRDEFRLAVVGAPHDFDELVALLVEAQAYVSQSLPGRNLQVERFDDVDRAEAWARDDA